MLEPSRIETEECFASSGDPSENTVFFGSLETPLTENFFWTINKSQLNVYDLDNLCESQLIARFDFEHVYSDPSLSISFVLRCVDRYEDDDSRAHPFKLIVVMLSSQAERSLISIVDIRGSRILSTISFPYAIYAVDLVSSSSNDKLFAEALQPLSGILAVGTLQGNVFLLDLRLDSLPDDPHVASEITYAYFQKATREEVIQKRVASCKHGQNLVFMVNPFSKKKSSFVYNNSNNDSVLRFDSQLVYVSALYFIPTSASLAVGFNFGGFQVISLKGSVHLDYSQELVTKNDKYPVVAFNHQLPEFDPKNFVYLWVVRGVHGKALNIYVDTPVCSRVYLHRLLYEDKDEKQTELGCIYSKFQCQEQVLGIPLACDPLNNDSRRHTSSKLIDIFSLQRHQISSIQDFLYPTVIDNRYTIFVWSAGSTLDAFENQKDDAFFAIFDLNQWYSSLEPVAETTSCLLSSFLQVYSLSKVNALLSSKDQIQGLQIDLKNFERFHLKNVTSNQQMHILNHPQSLSFSTTVITQEKILQAKFTSLQKRTLNSLFSSKHNVSILFDKDIAVISPLLKSGLVNESFENDDDIMDRPGFILNLALENNYLDFLQQVVQYSCQEVKPESEDQGFDFIEWITKQVESLKKSIDQNTEALFDFSSSALSPDELRILGSAEHSLRFLLILLRQFEAIQRTKITFDLYQGKIEALTEVIMLVQDFLHLIMTFHHLGILPDRLPSPIYDSLLCYNSELMRNSYKKARECVISRQPSAFPDSRRVFCIDIITHFFEEVLREAWTSENGIPIDDPNGAIYPPQNLHCICRTMLCDRIPDVIRESLIVYFLMDFVRANPNIGDESYVLQFFQTRVMNTRVQDFILGLWYTDQHEFNEAFEFLTSPNTLVAIRDLHGQHPELMSEIINRVLELFMFDDHVKLALQLVEIFEIIPMNQTNELLYIYLLVLDKKHFEALDFMRRRRTEENAPIFMQQFLTFSQQSGCLPTICMLELDAFEEAFLMVYLENLKSDSSKLLSVFYLLRQNKFIEALNFCAEKQVDFAEWPQLLELLTQYDKMIPIEKLEVISKAITLIEAKIESSSVLNSNDLKFDQVDQPVLKINPRNLNRKIVSKSEEIELEMIARETMKSMNSPDLAKTPSMNRSARFSLSSFTPLRDTSFGTPRLSGVSKTKVKLSAKKKNPFASLLKTPDVKRQVILEHLSQSIRPPSSLKRTANDSDSVSSDASRLKSNVKFRIAKPQISSPVAEEDYLLVTPDSLDDVEDVETKETEMSTSEVEISTQNDVSSDKPQDLEAKPAEEVFKIPETPVPETTDNQVEAKIPELLVSNDETKQDSESVSQETTRPRRRSVTPVRLDDTDYAVRRSTRSRTPVRQNSEEDKKEQETAEPEPEQEVPSTPRRRSTRSRTPVRQLSEEREFASQVESKADSGDEPPSTPRRRSTRSRTPTREVEERVSTPIRRLSRASSRSRDTEAETESEEPRPGTPRRSTRSRTPVRETEERPSTPTRRSRNTKSNEEKEDDEKKEEILLPAKLRLRTVKSQEKNEDEASASDNQTEKANEETKEAASEKPKSKFSLRTKAATSEEPTPAPSSRPKRHSQTPQRFLDEDERPVSRSSRRSITPTREVAKKTSTDSDLTLPEETPRKRSRASKAKALSPVLENDFANSKANNETNGPIEPEKELPTPRRKSIKRNAKTLSEKPLSPGKDNASGTAKKKAKAESVQEEEVETPRRTRRSRTPLVSEESGVKKEETLKKKVVLRLASKAKKDKDAETGAK